MFINSFFSKRITNNNKKKFTYNYPEHTNNDTIQDNFHKHNLKKLLEIYILNKAGKKKEKFIN